MSFRLDPSYEGWTNHYALNTELPSFVSGIITTLEDLKEIARNEAKLQCEDRDQWVLLKVADLVHRYSQAHFFSLLNGAIQANVILESFGMKPFWNGWLDFVALNISFAEFRLFF